MKFAIKIALLFLILILIIAGLSVYWTFFKLAPTPERTVSLEGLQQEVTVLWDSWQVPHIIAGRETDAFMAMGYIHAQSRLWQMTLYQYKLEGLHSAEIDESLLYLDRFYVTLGFAETAKESFRQLSLRHQQYLQAYSDGINQYVNENRNHLPVSFTLSDAQPVSWEPWHAIGVQLLWAWEHQHSFWTKLGLNTLHEHQNSELTRVLTGLDLPHSSLFGIESPTLDSGSYNKLVQDFRSFTQNIYPARTGRGGSGFAMARQNPEPLGVLSFLRESELSNPDQGYEVVLRVGERQRAGITIPGFPAILYGQNEYVAWALQPLAVDDGDFFSGELFSEDIRKSVDWKRDPSVYDLLSDNISLHRHILSLKNGSEYQLVTQKAEGKPIVAISENKNKYLAFDWPGFQPEADFGSYLDLALSRDLSELENAMQGIRIPAVQLLFVSREGLAGRLTGGLTFSRAEPLAIRSHNDAVDIVPAGSMIPGVVRSDEHPVFFLEKRPANLEENRYLSLFFTPWDRSHRYLELFEATAPEHAEYHITEEWHNDIHSLFAASLTPKIIRHLEATPPDSLTEVILPYMRNWNFEFGSNETAATVFELFLRKSAKNLYQHFLGDVEIDMLFTAPQIPVSAVQHLIEYPDDWPDVHPLDVEEWIGISMQDAVRYLVNTFGDEPHYWQWAFGRSSVCAVPLEEAGRSRGCRGCPSPHPAPRPLNREGYRLRVAWRRPFAAPFQPVTPRAEA